MNKYILNTGVQNFIQKNLNTDIVSVLLKNSIFDGVDSKLIAEQIEAKKKCRDKLPLWYKTTQIYYPNKLNIEQTSSEKTAAYKAEIVTGKSLLDLTGGFGIDSYFFSKKINEITHCEIDKNLSEIASHNFKKLGAKNIKCIAENGLEFITKTGAFFDWIFIDPSRRNQAKGKVFFLEDCLPNIPENLELLFSKTDTILIKTSPLLDLAVGIKSLQNVKEIHVVAIQNEVKELLWIVEKEYTKSVLIKTVNLKKSATENFNFRLSDEKKAQVSYSEPQKYLYEPNAAILKSGAFKSVAAHFQTNKIAEHSHLYTSNKAINFPGRRFLIQKHLVFNKKEIQKLQITKANITVRNFPDSVSNIRKKFKIKDGGETYLFFTTNIEEKKIVLICKKQ